jgi:MFS family permease
MTVAPPNEGPPSTATGRVSEWFGQAAEIVTGVAGFSYAFGWILTARFFGSLGIDPEEVGISFSWLAIRAFLVGLAGLVIFLGAQWLLQAAERSEPVVHVIQSRAAIVALIVLCCMSTAGLVALSLTAWVAAHDGTVGWASVVAILACGAITAVTILWLRPPTVRLAWNSRLWLRGVAGALLGFIAVTLLVTPYRLGDYLGSEVRNNKAAHLPVAPGVPALQVTRVRLTPVNSQAPAPALGCVLRLGGNGSTSIYYASGRVLRVSDQNVTVNEPC